MKTLSIKQPWAYLIASGLKDIENRSWRTKFRGRIYIHAGLTPTTGFYSEFLRDLGWKDFTEETRFEIIKSAQFRGAIIGEVDIIDCVKDHRSIWAESNCWNWVLANPICYPEPIMDVKGKLSLWEYSPT